MKNLVLLLFLIAFSLGCKKDSDMDSLTIQNDKKFYLQNNSPYNPSNWSQIEKDFFSSKTDKLSRNSDFVVLNPIVESARHEIIRQNQENDFVDRIAQAGKPMWAQSNVLFNPNTKENLVIIPMTSWRTGKVSGLITVTKQFDNLSRNSDLGYVINATTKESVLQNERGSKLLNRQYSEWMILFDEKLGNEPDDALIDVYCQTREISEIETNPPSACEWIEIEVCGLDEYGEWYINWSGGVSFNSATSWFDGDQDNDGHPDKGACGPPCDDRESALWFEKIFPLLHDFWRDYNPETNLEDVFDGDHDDDGIPDALDPDYPDWYKHFLDEWTKYYPAEFLDWFDGDHDNDGIPDEDDPDYQEWYDFLVDDIRDPNDDYGDQGGDGDNFWDDYDWDDWTDIYDDFSGDDDNGFPDEGEGDGDWPGQEGPDIPCPDWGFQGSGSSNRSGNCSTYYVKYCGGSIGINWWDAFDDVLGDETQAQVWQLIDEKYGNLDRDTEEWLMDHPELLGELLTGDIDLELVSVLMQIKTHQDKVNAITTLLESEGFTGGIIDDDLWDILFELMKEVLPELIPGVDTFLDIKRSMEEYNNGNYWTSAASFSSALLTLTPADKIKDFAKLFKTSRKGYKIFKLLSKLNDIAPALAKGFKKTVLDKNKMHHIFGKIQHGLAGITKKIGGEENLIYKIYDKIGELGLDATIPNAPNSTEIVVTILGYDVTVRVTKVNGIVTIGTVFIRP